MKKFIFLLFLFFGKHALAQEYRDISLVNRSQRHFDFANGQEGLANLKGYINNVNSRAVRNLLKTFDDANNIQWKIDDQQITAYFIQGDVRVKLRYDKDGHHISTRKIYGESKLDRYVAFIAKKNLDKSFLIAMVTELVTDDGRVYEITLQNKWYWCVVKIGEDREGFLEKLSEDQIFLKV